MALALLFALALSGAQPTSTPAPEDAPLATTQPKAPDASAPAGDATEPGEKPMTRDEIEDTIPDGAPKDDYRFVAWCHGALAGQIELDPIVEKDMDAIEGKAKAAKHHADDVEIAKEHRKYLALYEKALSAAEKASPTAIHQDGMDAEVQGYKIWGPTRNKQPVWRMVDWGNWEVPPHCEKAAKRLYDKSSLFGAALKTEETPTPVADVPAQPPAKDDAAAAPAKDASDAPAAPAPKATAKKVTKKRAAKVPTATTPAATPAPDTSTAPAADAPDPGKATPPATPDSTPSSDGLRGPQ